MATPRCVTLLDRYLASLRDQYETQETEAGCLLLTPFYLPDNTQLGVRCTVDEHGQLAVTDDGETFENLFLSGLNVSTNDARLQTIAQRFGVSIDEGTITKTGSADQPGTPINDVIHAMLDMAYLIYTRRPRAVPNFAAEVEQRLIELDRRYDRRPEVSGFTAAHRFDYGLLDRSAHLLVDMLSTTDRQSSYDRARITSFKAGDVRRASESGYRFACLVDDRTPSRKPPLLPRY